MLCPGQLIPSPDELGQLIPPLPQEDFPSSSRGAALSPWEDRTIAKDILPQRTVLSSQLGDISTRLAPWLGTWTFKPHSPWVPAPAATLTNLRLQDLPLQASFPRL